MNFHEKKLYHQIHPVKLFVNWGTGAAALYFLWHQNILLAFLVMFIPSIIASLIIMFMADMEKYKRSSLGKYISKYMTPFWEGIRFIGFAIALVGAWLHYSIFIMLGILIVFFGWIHGLILRRND